MRDKNEKEIRDLSQNLSKGQQLKLKAKINSIRNKQTSLLIKRETKGDANIDRCDFKLQQEDHSDTE